MFEDINETANELAKVITVLDDPEKIAEVIRNALVLERTAQMPDVDQIVPLLAFLFYLREEKGPTYMYGGHQLEEAFEAACAMSRIDKDKIITGFKD